MRDFIKNEWKTLLLTLLCVGSLFGYFRITDPSLKGEEVSEKNKCFFPGESLRGIKLGEASADTEEIFGEVVEAKDYFGVRVEKRAKGMVAYRGKDVTAAAIKRGEDKRCDREASAWFKSRQAVGELRFSSEETWLLYDGAADIVMGDTHYTCVRHDLP